MYNISKTHGPESYKQRQKSKTQHRCSNHVGRVCRNGTITSKAGTITCPYISPATGKVTT